MGRVVLACKSDEERKMARCPVFAPYPIHTSTGRLRVRDTASVSDLGSLSVLQCGLSWVMVLSRCSNSEDRLPVDSLLA